MSVLERCIMYTRHYSYYSDRLHTKSLVTFDLKFYWTFDNCGFSNLIYCCHRPKSKVKSQYFVEILLWKKQTFVFSLSKWWVHIFMNPYDSTIHQKVQLFLVFKFLTSFVVSVKIKCSSRTGFSEIVLGLNCQLSTTRNFWTWVGGLVARKIAGVENNVLWTTNVLAVSHFF